MDGLTYEVKNGEDGKKDGGGAKDTHWMCCFSINVSYLVMYKNHLRPYPLLLFSWSDYFTHTK